MFIVWLASAMVVASVPIAGVALASGRQPGHRASRVLAGHSPTMREAVLQRSLAERLLQPITRRVGSWLIRFTPIGWAERRNLAVARAGLPGRISAEQLLGAKLLLPLVLAVTFAMQLIGSGEPGLVAMAVVSVVLGFFTPDLLLRARADRRSEEVTRALPDVLDQVTILVEAGLDFEPALSRSSTGKKDPLSQEFLRMLQDIRLGATRADALAAMSKRSQVNDLRLVVLALRQADALGVPLSATLRNLSVEMREKRRFRAEAKAQRLPTLMVLPLGLCILPALFIVILGPAFLAVSGNGG